MDKKQFKMYIINAFSKGAFSGNPAAVVPLQQWLEEETIQKIAQQNNLAETAFFIPVNKQCHPNEQAMSPNNFKIRWFTPNKEVDLCGHATLASAYVLYNMKNDMYTNFNLAQPVIFESKSGPLLVSRQNETYTLDFPICKDHIVPKPPIQLFQGLGIKDESSVEVYKGMDYLVIFNSEEQVREVRPNCEDLKKLGNEARGVIITSKCNNTKDQETDFICRFFAPAFGIDEDPVTGSAFTQLGPYWAKRIGKDSLNAIQVSQRKGYINCKVQQERVLISGKADLYMEGCIYI